MTAPRPATIDLITAEVESARDKFPTNRFLLAALMEEVGELAKAMMESAREDNPFSRESIVGEAKQVAAMAIRIIEEGDPDYPDSIPTYKYPTVSKDDD